MGLSGVEERPMSGILPTRLTSCAGTAFEAN